MTERVDAEMVADERDARGVLNDAEPETETARRPQEESRSTSSSTSPIPPDNEESDFFLAADDSQSSLGMPNLQDMHVSDDQCIEPINRLPNELLIAIFAKLNTPSDLLHVMLVCKRWSRNAVDLLWHRPSCTTWKKHESICRTLALEKPYFAYRDFVKRLNLSALAGRVNDGSVMPLAACTRVERLTLTGCANLTDLGLIALVSCSNRLYSLDVSLGHSASSADVLFNDQISDTSIYALAEHCTRLQGLNVSGCRRISNESLIQLARSCRQLKRVSNAISSLHLEPSCCERAFN
jgi:F-box and leucine-rich repeat protein GRR1